MIGRILAPNDIHIPTPGNCKMELKEFSICHFKIWLQETRICHPNYASFVSGLFWDAYLMRYQTQSHENGISYSFVWEVNMLIGKFSLVRIFSSLCEKKIILTHKKHINGEHINLNLYNDLNSLYFFWSHSHDLASSYHSSFV